MKFHLIDLFLGVVAEDFHVSVHLDQTFEADSETQDNTVVEQTLAVVVQNS